MQRCLINYKQIQEMIQIDCQCSECTRKIKANIGQTSIDLQLRWYFSYCCPYCDCVIEMDDIGFPPQDIRRAILAQEGEWELVIDKTSLSDKVKALKILRNALNLSIQKASKLKKNFPYLASGTKAEMNWLKKFLGNEKIESVANKKGDL